MKLHLGWCEAFALSGVLGLVTACSGSSTEGDASQGGAGAVGTAQGGSSSGHGGMATGGGAQGGSAQAGTGQGGSAQAGTGQGGSVQGGTGGHAGGVGGSAGGSAGQAVGGEPGGGGEGGAPQLDPACVLESLDLKVSGGANLERKSQAPDSCGGVVGGPENELLVSFILNPPELPSSLLISVIVDDYEIGTPGPLEPSYFSILATGAIWSMFLPNPEQPLACSLDLKKFEMAPSNHWRLAGSISCPAALSGIGDVGKTPLTIEKLDFSALVSAPPP